MNGPHAKIVPEINLDEFERHLRSEGAPEDIVEDPLAELTRLVDMISRDNGDGQRPSEPAARSVPAPAPPPPPLPRAPQIQVVPQIQVEPPVDAESEPFILSHDERADLLAAAQAQEAAGRGRAWYMKTAGLAIVGIALFGGAAALKFRVAPGVSRAPPFIAAAEGPNKIQPPSDATVQSAGDAGALLMRDSATSAPVKVVSNEEQPVDLGAQTPTPSPTASDPSPVAPAADTPVIAPAEATATVAPLFPDAKPVKTVSVRPDGTLISSDAGSSAPPSPAPSAKTVIRVADNSNAPDGAAPEPATPKLDLPTKLSPKSSARVVAKTDTTAPAGATETTPNAPQGLAPKSRSAKAPAGEAVADAANDTPAASGRSGDWAVQFSAPRSEADAKNEITRLKKRYADALGDADIGVHKADVKGETIYRVRSAGLAKADAAALCSKLKAAGGDCFIARN